MHVIRICINRVRHTVAKTPHARYWAQQRWAQPARRQPGQFHSGSSYAREARQQRGSRDRLVCDEDGVDFTNGERRPATIAVRRPLRGWVLFLACSWHLFGFSRPIGVFKLCAKISDLTQCVNTESTDSISFARNSLISKLELRRCCV